MGSNIHLDFSHSTYKKILEEVFFTSRELEIIDMKRKHYDEWTNERIAMELCISPRQLQRDLKKISNKILDYLLTNNYK